MTKINRLKSGLCLLVAGAIPVLANGCSSTDNPISNATSALCCSDFQVGGNFATATFGLSGDAQLQFKAFAQASSDFAASANGMMNDITTACMNIAVDLGVDSATATSAISGKANGDLAKAWCGLAKTQLDTAFNANGALAAAGTITVEATPPRCDVSVQAQASCQGSCQANAACDIKATPPTCKGGQLVVSCTGQCDVTAEAPSIDCEGSCTAQCSGECTAQANVAVDCDGRCEGTCTAGGAANGSGLQADGSCKGTCSGKCDIRAGANVTCSGSCTGKCTGSCKATPGSASVKCGGKCTADATPISCEGGHLEGGCMVDANCQANCNASASAKASCKPGSISIVASGAAALTGDALAKFQGAVQTLERNLPAIVTAAKARGQQLVDLGVDLVGTAGAAANVFISGNGSVQAAGCAPIILQTIQTASNNVAGSVSGCNDVLASAKVGL